MMKDVLGGGETVLGYIKAVREELRLREYEYYRASYCGLCRAMGRCTGQCSRLTLNYDFLLLANVRMALRGIEPSFRRRRCLAHPFRRRWMMEPNAELDFAADAAAILAFEKCRDDVADERGVRKIKARLRCFWLKGAYRRAKKRHEALARRVRDHLGALALLEAEKCPSADEAADAFAALLAELMAEGFSDDLARIAQSIGWQTGRFIYLLDAIDDLPQDEKRGRYNPLLLHYGGVLTAAQRAEVETALTACLADLSAAVDLMPQDAVAERRAVLENILYLGMPAALRRVLYAQSDRREAADE